MNDRKLYLSDDNKMIAGVAGGVAEYLDIEPVIIRLIWAFAAFSGGVGALAYIIGIMVIPKRPVGEPRVTIEGSARQPNRTAGIIMVLVGLVFLLNNFLPSIPWGLIWPVALVAVGVYYLAKAKK